MVATKPERLLCALAAPSTRATVAESLARDLGASALIAFVPDAEIGVLLPAAGFVQTVPGGASWRAFLSHCAAPGVHRGSVAYPDDRSLTPAVARTLPDGVVFVLIGDQPDIEALDSPALALLGALMRSESAVRAAEARAAAAQSSAQHSGALMKALDSARAEAENARNAAERATRSKDEFLALLGHELRNPLSPIITALQVLKLRGVATMPELGIIERQAGHLVTLVDDLLDVSRITRGKVELRLEHTEILPVIESALEVARPLLARRSHELVLAVPPSGLTVRVDLLRMKQVIANLLTNAAKYTPPGGKIEVSAARADRNVRITVRDNGIGISEDLLPVLFDMFVQGERTSDRAEGGLGIGLALVRNLVQMHAGSVEARSQGPGLGSEFVVDIPADDGAPDALPAAPSLPPVLAPRRRPHRILVVDDNVDAAGMLIRALAASGHQVSVAHDGPAALALVDQFRPDVAILDIGLPVMDGYELGAHLQRRDPAPHLIALTGYGREQDHRRSDASGFERHFVKPIDVARLLEAIDEILAAA